MDFKPLTQEELDKIDFPAMFRQRVKELRDKERSADLYKSTWYGWVLDARRLNERLLELVTIENAKKKYRK